MTTIKKVIISNDEFPLIQVDDIGLYYAIRYRIVSEDRNRYSHWSPIYRVDMPPTSDADLPYDGDTDPERIHINSIGSNPKTIIVTWSHPQEGDYNADPDKAILERIFTDVESYDVYIRWSLDNSPSVEEDWDTPWEYFSTISSNTLSILKPSTPNYATIGVEIQIPTLIKNRDTRLTLFKVEQGI
jgi:hypothetical protein